MLDIWATWVFFTPSEFYCPTGENLKHQPSKNKHSLSVESYKKITIRYNAELSSSLAGVTSPFRVPSKTEEHQTHRQCHP